MFKIATDISSEVIYFWVFTSKWQEQRHSNSCYGYNFRLFLNSRYIHDARRPARYISNH